MTVAGAILSCLPTVIIVYHPNMLNFLDGRPTRSQKEFNNATTCGQVSIASSTSYRLFAPTLRGGQELTAASSVDDAFAFVEA
jgi:hypothetical protein